MKYAIMSLAMLMSACATVDPELQSHLAAEQDFHAHQYHVQQVAEHPEYVDDCYYYYEELVCEFE